MKSMALRLVIVAVCLAGASAYLAAANRDEVIPPRTPLGALPMTIDNMTGRREADLTPEVLAVLGADDYITRTYRGSDASIVGLYIGYHQTQREGDTIHSPLNCLPGAGWIPLEQGRKTVEVTGWPETTAATPIEINRVVIGKGLDRQLVLYWYQSHRRVVAGEYWGKIYTVLDSIRYHRTDAALVRVITPMEDEGGVSADARAEKFVQKLFPLLIPHLPS
jgi:EpsI family protein